MIRLFLYIFSVSFLSILFLCLVTSFFSISFNSNIIFLSISSIIFLFIYKLKKPSFLHYKKVKFSNNLLKKLFLFGVSCAILQFIFYGLPILKLLTYDDFKTTSHITFFFPIGVSILFLCTIISIYEIFFINHNISNIFILVSCFSLLTFCLARSYLMLIFLFFIFCFFFYKGFSLKKKILFIILFGLLFSYFFSVYSNMKTNNVLQSQGKTYSDFIESKDIHPSFFNKYLFFWPIIYTISPIVNLSNINEIDYSFKKFFQYTFLNESKIVAFGIDDRDHIKYTRKQFLIDDNFNTSSGFLYPYYFGGTVGMFFYLGVNFLFLFFIGNFLINKNLKHFFTIFISSIVPLIFFTNIFVQPFFIYPILIIIFISLLGNIRKLSNYND